MFRYFSNGGVGGVVKVVSPGQRCDPGRARLGATGIWRANVGSIR
jgi:hypothetical protein